MSAKCPKCGQAVNLAGVTAGKSITCPHCGKVLTVSARPRKQPDRAPQENSLPSLAPEDLPPLWDELPDQSLPGARTGEVSLPLAQSMNKPSSGVPAWAWIAIAGGGLLVAVVLLVVLVIARSGDNGPEPVAGAGPAVAADARQPQEAPRSDRRQHAEQSQAPKSQAPKSQAPKSQAPKSQAPDVRAPDSLAPEAPVPSRSLPSGPFHVVVDLVVRAEEFKGPSEEISQNLGGPVVVNDSGQIAFTLSTFKDTHMEWVLFRQSRDGKRETIYKGQAQAGNSSTLTMNNRGQILFLHDNAIRLATGNRVELLAKAGDAAPGIPGGRFTIKSADPSLLPEAKSPLQPRESLALNDAGVCAFTTYVETPDGLKMALWCGAPGKLAPVAVSGAILERVGTSMALESLQTGITPDGEVVFALAGDHTSSAPGRHFWRYHDGKLTEIPLPAAVEGRRRPRAQMVLAAGDGAVWSRIEPCWLILPPRQGLALDDKVELPLANDRGTLESIEFAQMNRHGDCLLKARVRPVPRDPVILGVQALWIRLAGQWRCLVDPRTLPPSHPSLGVTYTALNQQSQAAVSILGPGQLLLTDPAGKLHVVISKKEPMKLRDGSEVKWVGFAPHIFDGNAVNGRTRSLNDDGELVFFGSVSGRGRIFRARCVAGDR